MNPEPVRCLMPKNSTLALTCSLLSVLSFAPFLSAATVVQWGGNYVSANQVLANTAYPSDYYVTNEMGQSYGALKGSIQSLNPSSGYNAPVGATSGFSGGWMASQGTAPGFPGDESGDVGALNNRVVYEKGANDRISLAVSGPGVTPAIRGLVVFNKSNFLNGMSGETVSFDGSSQLSFSGVMDGYRPVGNWVVQDGSNWYISQTQIVQSEYNTVESHTLDSLNEAQWALFQPVVTDSFGTYFFNSAPTTGYGTHSFTNVQSVGIFFDSYGQPNTDGGFSRFALQEFSATAVPEPGILALASLGIIVFGVRRWRQIRA